MAKIFLIEDDEALAMGLLFTLEQEGYQTVRASSARQAREIYAQGGFDLILLDVMLPDGNGYDLCKEFKQTSDIPIVFLTSCDDELNIVMGLDGGGDDYVTKPFLLKVLISRIKAQLRRSNKETSAQIHFGNLAVDLEQSKAFCGEKEISLTATELRLLATLVRHAGQTLTRTSLLDRLWDSKGEFVDDNTLSVHIRHLREKLDAAVSNACIVTVRGVGYRMEVME
ncbi:MAG: response regulator transcription factor [Clostridiales bacterium]|jgi:DNA-binding response OmpR family regulator|nr:response regulator transcription factor [Clostridiales bacterium]